MKMTAFSALLCTYAKDNPLHLRQSLQSISSQTVLPNELVIVKDGPLPESLESVISGFQFPNKLTTLALPKNIALGQARAKGLKVAKHPWVALMDSDDICLANRFEEQLSLISASPMLDIVGGQILEFDDIPGKALAMRKVPPTHNEIVARGKKSNPFNAMTVMFKKDLALSAGNFRHFPGFEDYDLWMRMVALGAKCANSMAVLVHARIGNGMYARRKGFAYMRSEWRMQRNLRQLGLITTGERMRNVLTRIPIRLLPDKGLAFVYNKFARGGA